MNNEQISALLDHNAELRAENAELRAALIDCVGLIDAFMLETLNKPFPANNAPEIIRIAREILEK